MKIISKSVEIGGRTLTLEVGRFAEQATAAVLARYGDTMVIATVVASSSETKLNYFPLSVEYVERLYAGGRIKGSRWVKREGRPSDDAILSGRLIDRSIRPLFDKRYRHDIQVIVTVLSVDGENEPDILGIIATSAALAISPIPWRGPIGAVRVGYIPPSNGKGGYFANPQMKEIEFSEMDLVATGNNDKIVMLEVGANELNEEIIFSGTKYAKDEINKIIGLISELVKDAGKKKIEIKTDLKSEKLISLLKTKYQNEVAKSILARVTKETEGDELILLCDTIFEKYGEEYTKKEIEEALEYLFKEKLRSDILAKKRADGRGERDIRDINIEAGILPRTHGSAMFKRGQTQVLTVATLGSPSLEQLIESPEGESAKRYMHHYSMPPYSVGETGRIGVPSRREVGHGALAERALKPVIPSQEIFPYTIRLVSEVMSSNGSTSMAATCGSTLALMDAGVPIKNPVAGIAMGLITSGDSQKYIILSDIIGIEDFSGDMDFKVAGSSKGITAIQLDVKIDGLTDRMIEETLAQARLGVEFILDKMLKTLPSARATLSRYAPRVSVINIPQTKIGDVIGPGGKVIRQIIADTGCDINVDDNGQVTIAGTEPEKVELAHKWISGIIKEVQPEEVYQGIVKRILPFGAFVEILPGREGMVHVSQMATGFVSDPTTVVSIGQQVTVRVMEIDMQGRINLSMLFGEDAKKQSPPRREKSFDRPRRRF